MLRCFFSRQHKLISEGIILFIYLLSVDDRAISLKKLQIIIKNLKM